MRVAAWILVLMGALTLAAWAFGSLPITESGRVGELLPIVSGIAVILGLLMIAGYAHQDPDL